MHLHLFDTLAAHRAERAERRHLADELAAYRSHADRLEIESILDRYTDEETHQIRKMLTAQAA